jgi:probable HAF family extracellular repeat protein
MHDLGTLGGDHSEAFGINDAGRVVGLAYTPAGEWHWHAFLWDGTMHDLGTLGGDWSEAEGINAAGQVVGSAGTANLRERAFLWDGAMHDLGTLGGDWSKAYGINDAGQVVGSAQTADGYFHAFLWDGAMHDLGTLDGWCTAYGINDAGQVVGYADTTPDLRLRAFLWDQDHGMRDLNGLIPPDSGWELALARDINEAGWIVGYGYIGGETHAFLAMPCGRVVGTVTDARTDKPLAEVKVKAYNKAGDMVATTQTEADGTYVLVLPEDTYRLKFKKKGYRSVTAKGVVVTAGEDTVVDVKMRKK